MIEILKCTKCNGNFIGDPGLCDPCAGFDNYGAPYTKDTIFVEHYGKSSKAQMDELERRVIIKHRSDGGYILGRRGENGKIQERHPDYRP